MKLTFPRPVFPRGRGFALVIVMVFAALSLILVTAMLTRSTTEQQISGAIVAKTKASILAENTIAIAVAQLRKATEQNFSTQTPKPWTSQPGAIRVHQADGSLETLYKLYSAADMEAGALTELNADLPPADWQVRTDLFADLNAPVHNGSLLRFPILDPRAAAADLGPAVEGFHYGTGQVPAGTVGDEAASADDRRLPMPVRWLYMLQDGTLGTLAPDGSFISTVPGKIPTQQNPLAGRIAFWMDDETSKINVNTASEGAFWDTPRADTQQERLLALKQPNRLEYHRQPGHPAGVSLSSVLLPGRRYHPEGFTSKVEPMPLQDARDLWRIGRLAVANDDTGSSKGGTAVADTLAMTSLIQRPLAGRHRYTDIDEMVFNDVSSAGDKNTAAGRRPQSFFDRHAEGLARLTRGRGFLTTDSTAPEVTLYGTPRIALWTVYDGTPSPGENRSGDEQVIRYTSYDRTVLLASMLGEQRYLVQRRNPGDGAMDLEINANGQNLRLLNYMRRLTDRPVPGFHTQGSTNATFAAKYGTDSDSGDRDAILLSMMDYVRSTNFADGHLEANNQFSVLCESDPHYGFGQVAALQFRHKGTSREAAKADTVKAFGRMMTVSEISLLIVCRAEVDEDGKIQGTPSSINRRDLKNPGDREMEVGLLVEGFMPQQGWTDYRPYVSIGIVGGEPGAAPHPADPWPALKLNGKPLVPMTATNAMMAEARPPKGWRGWGGSTGVRGLTKGSIVFRSVVIPAQEDGGTAPLQFEGASSETNQLKLLVYDTPEAVASPTVYTDLAQVIPIKLPDIGMTLEPDSVGIPLPKLPVGYEIAYPIANRLRNAATKGTSLITPEDIVHSLLPAHGDYRLMAARRWLEKREPTVSKPFFVAHPDWGLRRHAHALNDPTCWLSSTGAQAMAANESSDGDKGFFYYQLQVPPSVQPDFPQARGLPMMAWLGSGWSKMSPQSLSDHFRLDNGVRGTAWPDFTGDFDNGAGNSADGPFTNRSDDGNWAAQPMDEIPYFAAEKTSQAAETVPPVSLAGFSGQRLLPSPVMFGSLPTGTRSNVPWQTLLFRPHPQHYGASDPPDHLLLDFFWSPVVEPEPVSRPFETAGKVNLNHQILPFHHIHRSTALHAVMKAETLMAIPDSAADSYKTGQRPENRFRHYLDAEGTLKLWKERVFDTGRVFLSPSEICVHPLVPEGVAAEAGAIDAFWSQHRLTGDNTKERPYAHLHPRLTTRSNTFRLHYVVETIHKVRTSDPAKFDRERDRISARQQGSCMIRRHLDPKTKNLPDYLTESAAPSLENFYHWEIYDHCPLP